MTEDLIRLLPGPQCALDAAVVAAASAPGPFEAATGWPLDARSHRYDREGHHIPAGAAEALGGAMAAESAADPCFGRFVDAGRRAAAALLRAAESASADSPSPDALRELLTQAENAAACMVAAPLVRADLKARIVAAGASLEDELEAAAPGIAAAEARSLFAIAAAIATEPAARELVIERSANAAAGAIAAGFPDLHARITGHLAEYGWVRSAGTSLAPLTVKQLLRRAQVPLLRWDTATISRAATVPAATVPAATVPAAASQAEGPGRSPGAREAAADGPMEAYRTLSGLAFSPGLLAKARWLAAGLFEAAGRRLDCPAELLAQATPDELLRALEGREALPSEELAARAANGFIVERDGAQVTARAYAQPLPDLTLTGQTVSRGLAVGRVKVVFGPDDDPKLQFGDVLVTGMSTPNYEGQPSVFPYRTVPAVSVDKAAAVVTDEGGLLSHAAIICRENQVPTVLGTDDATRELRDGMVVEVDATRGDGRVTILPA